MTMHDLGSALPAIIAIGFAVNGLLRLRARNARAAAERAAASGPPVPNAERPRTPVRRPSPFASVNAPAAPAKAPAKRPAPVAARAVAAYAAPSGLEPLPALAADAFPVLDLTLPGATPSPAGAPAARMRRRAGFPGGRGWGASGIVALEVLGPPVSLRAGATLGAPHAF